MVSPRKRVRNAMGFRILVVLFSMAWRWKVYVQGMFCTYVLCTSYIGNARWRWICWVQFISETQSHRHDLKMSRNGNCDAKHHGNASAGTMVRLQLVFHGQGKQKQSTKHTKKRPNKGWSRTRSERGTKRGQKLPGTDPYQILELEDFRLQQTVAVEYAHPKTKKTNTEVTQMVIKWYHEIYQFT